VGDERAPDPLTSFISRSLRIDATDVSEEILQDTTEMRPPPPTGTTTRSTSGTSSTISSPRLA
jgi:hypothetical protein